MDGRSQDVAGAPCTVPPCRSRPTALQYFFFGDDLPLRRHDYNVDVAGGFAGAQLVYDYIESDGIRLPSRRRAYTRGTDSRPRLDPLMVSIDIGDVRFS